MQPQHRAELFREKVGRIADGIAQPPSPDLAPIFQAGNQTGFRDLFSGRGNREQFIKTDQPGLRLEGDRYAFAAWKMQC